MNAAMHTAAETTRNFRAGTVVLAANPVLVLVLGLLGVIIGVGPGGAAV